MNSQYNISVAAKNHFSKTFNNAEQASKSFKKEIQATQAAVKNLSNTQKDIKAYSATKKSIQETGIQLANYQREIKSTKRNIGDLTNQQKKLSTEKSILIKKEVTITKNSTAKITELEQAKARVKQQFSKKLKGLSKEEAARIRKNRDIKLSAISSEIKKQKEAISFINKKVKATKAEEKIIAQALKREKKAFQTSDKRHKTTAKRYEQQRRNLNALHQEITRAGYKTNNLSDAQKRLQVRTERANRAFQVQQAKLKQIGKLEKELGQAQEKRAKMAGDAAKAAVALYAVNKAINTSADFESAMVEVDKKSNFKNKSGTNLSQAEQAKKLSILERQILRDAPSLGLDPKEIAKIVASGAGSNIARDGYELEDLNRFTVLSAKMANAFDEMSPEEAGRSVAAWKASMGLTMEQLEMLAGSINHFSDNTAASTGALTKVLTDVGSVLTATGLDSVQSAALSAAVLAGNGNKAEMGRTAVKNLGLNLMLGDSATNKQKATYGKLGFDVNQLAKDMKTDAVGTMMSVFKRIKQEDGDKLPAIVNTLFGKESIGSTLALINNMDKMQRVFAIANDKVAIKNSLDKEFNKILQTYNFQKNKLASTFTSITTIIGAKLLPSLTAIVDGLSSAGKAGIDFMQNNEALTNVLIKSAAVLATLKAAQIAYRIGAVSVDILLKKRKITETALGGAVNRTSSAAMKATAAINRMNASMMMTGGGKGGRKGKGGKKGGMGAAAGVGAAATGGVASKAKGALSSIGRKLPIVGQVVGAGLLASVLMDGESETKGEEIGSIGGSMAGAAAGAALGSIVPIVGTLAGGIIGAFAGESLGEWLGSKADEALDNKPETAEQKAKETEAVQAKKELPIRTVKIDNMTSDQIPSLQKSQINQSTAKAVSQNNKKVEINLEHKPQIVINNSPDEAETRKNVEKVISESNGGLIQQIEKIVTGQADMNNLYYGFSDGSPSEVNA